MASRLAEPQLRLTALAGWVAPHRRPLTTTGPTEIHWATLGPATDDHQGTAACGEPLARDEQWWRATRYVVDHAARRGDVWTPCGGCLYWAGGLPC